MSTAWRVTRACSRDLTTRITNRGGVHSRRVRLLRPTQRGMGCTARQWRGDAGIRVGPLPNGGKWGARAKPPKRSLECSTSSLERLISLPKPTFDSSSQRPVLARSYKECGPAAATLGEGLE